MNVLKMTEPKLWGFIFTVENGSIIGKKEKTFVKQEFVSMPTVSAFNSFESKSVSAFGNKDKKVDYIKTITNLAKTAFKWVIKHRKSAY